MKPNWKAKLFAPFVLAVACCGGASATPAHSPSDAKVAPDKALEKLKAGNARFVTHKAHGGRVSVEMQSALAKAQHPFAIIVTCSDSRVGPEIVFDQSLGDVFVVRCAGALVDKYDLGSIEYAIEHLGAQLVVVMGHERCGAVKAATEVTDAPGHVGDLVKAIRPAVEAARKHGDKSLDGAVKENTREVAAGVAKDVKGTGVKVVAAHFDLDTGKVEFLK